MANIGPELESAKVAIEKMARQYGLDFFETIFELINYDEMNQIAAYGGFPVRYPHWRFGMDYERMAKSYQYGLSKIYEMVINTDPCYAYLMEGNSFMDQKMVMAHVYGHCDFFKNNKWFSKTNRKMVDVMANHATRVQRYIERHGYEVVEKFIDKCLSIENLIDRHSVYSPLNYEGSKKESQKKIKKFTSENAYMDKFLNPKDWVSQQKNKLQEELETSSKVPEVPQRDVLKFLIDYADLEDWQQDVLGIIRKEAYYFAPQGMTKTINEGWASYWHSTMMTQQILSDSEIIDYADNHSGATVTQPGGFNPYKVGIELFRDIEQRWNRGQFGKEWSECDSYTEKQNWDKKTGLGRQKIFEVRRDYNDVTFIDEFLTEDFCVQHRLFVYQYNKKKQAFEINTKDFKSIKNKLLFQMTNFGQPIIEVENANYNGAGELLMRHLHEGVDLQPDYMEATMKNIFGIWKKPIHLATKMDDAEKVFTFDGEEIKDENKESLTA